VTRLTDELEGLGIEMDPQLLRLALTHRSWAYEHGRGATNERLEFLGDAVLGAIVTEHIFLQYADRPEGQLAKVRAAVVSGHALAAVARQLEIGPLLRLGRGEVATHGDTKDSILADATEAIIGAIHLTGGFAASGRFVHHVMDSLIATAAEMGAGLDWKSSLQELAAANSWPAPNYDFQMSGPDHERVFVAKVRVCDQDFGPGQATSRRSAEQKAAELAYQALAGAEAE
jgi:ribonuclease-3